MAKLRVQVDYDESPDYSYLEQWDTPEKYYGCAPKCSHGRPMEYTSDHSWKSSCWIDDECDETKNYIDNPEAFKAGEGECGVMKQEDRLLPFEEYKRTYGDPNNYVYLCAIVESLCEHCGEWAPKDSLSGLDIYENGPDLWDTGTFTPEQVADMSDRYGYLKDTLINLLAEHAE